jgi:acyl carrier protein
VDSNSIILANIIKKIMNNPDLVIDDKTNLIVDLGMDSITLMMLVIEIEEVFGIELPDSAFVVDKLANFYSILAVIESVNSS